MFDVALTRPLALFEPAAPELDLGLPERLPERRPQPRTAAAVADSAAPTPTGHLGRVVARSSDRVAWLRARSRGITATDVAKLSTPRSVRSAAYDKLHGTGFGGNVYTQHGRDREPADRILGRGDPRHPPERRTLPRRAGSAPPGDAGRPRAAVDRRRSSSPRSRRRTRNSAASRAATCVRSGGSSTCSAPSEPCSSGSSTRTSCRCTRSPSASGSTVTTPRSPSSSRLPPTSSRCCSTARGRPAEPRSYRASPASTGTRTRDTP